MSGKLHKYAWLGALLIAVGAFAQEAAVSRTDGTAMGAGSASTTSSEIYLVGTGDLLAIYVWRETELSRTVPVRPDGMISLPLVGELKASGKTPKQVETEIAAKLKDYVSQPEVTVIVQEIHSLKINVLGMVVRPGSFPLTKPMTVLDAIAAAGGFRDFAKEKGVYVLRRNAAGEQVRLAVNCKDVVKGRNAEQNILLESNDTIVVP